MNSIAGVYQLLTEQINPLIERAEQAFKALGYGVGAELALSDGKGLAFMKLDAEWRLLAVGDDGSLKPLCSTSRALRLEALGRLRDLEQALIEEARLQSGEANRILATASAFVEELERR